MDTSVEECPKADTTEHWLRSYDESGWGSFYAHILLWYINANLEEMFFSIEYLSVYCILSMDSDSRS